MHIVLLGHRDIASNVALSLLVTAMPQHRYSIMLSGAVASRSAPVAALVELAALEQKLCDDLAARGDLGLLSFDALARRTASNLQVLAQPNTLDGLSRLADHRPDLIISVRYRRILKDAAIAIPKFGVLNLHSGLLPEYKGMMATFWAMLNDEPTIGSTLHYIVDGTIDTGPIIGRAPVTADRSRSYLANVLSLYPDGCRMIIDAVGRIERGDEIACREQPAAGSYYAAPRHDDLAGFQDAGLRLFDGDELGQFHEDVLSSTACGRSVATDPA
jgi:methionyl-tRNA formyltransferase